LIVSGNNITSSGGGIKLGAATVAPIIAFNEIETLSGFTGSNGAVIDIDGSAAHRARNVLLTGNRIQVIAGNSDDHGIRINYADETHIEGNYFSRGSGSAKDIFLTSNASTTKIGENTWQDSVFANILSNAGVETSFAASLGGNTQMRQPLTFANGKSIGWYDDGGTARPVLTTQADGSVTVQGYHGNNFLVSSGGITYIYDSGSTKTLSAYAGRVGIGTISGALPLEALELPTTGKICWDTGSSACDVKQYRSAANQWRVITSGTDQFSVDSGFSDALTGLKIGTGAEIIKHLSATASLDFDFSGPGITCQDLMITVPGAADGDTVKIGKPNAAVTSGVQYFAWVSATDTVTVRGCDLTADNGNPPPQTFRADVDKH
jgi:hypothetical protein